MGIIELKGNDLSGTATDYMRATFDSLKTTLNIREGSSTVRYYLFTLFTDLCSLKPPYTPWKFWIL